MGGRKGKNDHGVIMLETLITLPVYLVMLAGLFWLGELCLARLTLTGAERLRLWERGNRNDPTDTAERTIFKFLASGTAVPPDLVTGESGFAHTFSPSTAANNWGSRISGYATIGTRRSTWSWGIADFVGKKLWSSVGDAPGGIKLAMKARVTAAEKSQPSMMLFRSGNDDRRGDLIQSINSPWRSNWDNSVGWNAVYLGNWDNFIVPRGGGATRIKQYNRNSYYLAWSK